VGRASIPSISHNVALFAAPRSLSGSWTTVAICGPATSSFKSLIFHDLDDASALISGIFVWNTVIGALFDIKIKKLPRVTDSGNN
jgi:hypothetical protein